MKHLERMSRNMDRHASELAIQRLRKDYRALKGLIGDWERELGGAQTDLSQSQTQAVVAGVAMFLSGVIAVFLAVMGREVICCSVVIGAAITPPSLIMLISQFTRMPNYRRDMAVARKKLRRLHAQLDECDKELRFHEGVVRR